MSFRRTLALLPLLFFAGCSAPSPATPKAVAPVASDFKSPKDDLGREIALQAPAKRAIVIGPGAIETVFALGAQGSLVGRDNYADFPAAAKKVAIAGNYQGPSVEKSVALRPDLVIVQGETWDRARVEQWQKQIGAPVAALVATDVEGVAKDIEKIGVWLGKNGKAHQVAAPLRLRVAPGVRFYSAFVEIGRSPLFTAGQNTLINSVLESGQWKNVARVNGYQPYGLESLLANPPTYYIVPSKANRTKVLSQLRAHQVLSKLKCVRQGQVVVVDPDLLLRPGPRLTQGIAKLRQAQTVEGL